MAGIGQRNRRKAPPRKRPDVERADARMQPGDGLWSYYAAGLARELGAANLRAGVLAGIAKVALKRSPAQRRKALANVADLAELIRIHAVAAQALGGKLAALASCDRLVVIDDDLASKLRRFSTEHTLDRVVNGALDGILEDAPTDSVDRYLDACLRTEDRAIRAAERQNARRGNGHGE
jgi:hypothetical protein